MTNRDQAPSSWLPILRRRGIPVLFYSLINQGYEDPYYQEILGVPKGLGRHRYLDGWVIIHSGDAEVFTAEFMPRLRERGYVTFFLDQCRSVADDLLAFGSRTRASGYRRSTTSELLLDFTRFCSLSIRIMPFLNTMVFVQDDIEARLSKVLSQHLNLPEDSPDVSALMQTLMSGGEMESLATRSLAELEAIATEIKSRSPELARRLKDRGGNISRKEIEAMLPTIGQRADQYLDAYDFFGTDYYLGEPSSFTDFISQLCVFLKKVDPQPRSKLDTPDVASLPDEDLHLLRTAQTLQFLREYRLEALFKSGRDCKELFSRIAETVGLGDEELMFLTFGEIQESLATGTLSLDLSAIQQRASGYGCDDSRVVVGAELDELLSQLPEAAPSSSTITGVTAFPGECVGPIASSTTWTRLARSKSEMFWRRR